MNKKTVSSQPFQIITYVTADPLVPAVRRCVAHCFDHWGQMLPATQMGETKEGCRSRLATFLSSEIAKASRNKAQRTPEEQARIDIRMAKARAKRWPKPVQ
jgi:hypothetical protein